MKNQEIALIKLLFVRIMDRNNLKISNKSTWLRLPKVKISINYPILSFLSRWSTEEKKNVLSSQK